MKRITAKDLALLTGAEIRNAGVLKAQPVTGVSTDSRTAAKGDLFFALKGENFDAHDFVPAVAGKDVTGVVIHRSWADANSEAVKKFRCVVVIVAETTAAFGELAAVYRRKFDIPVVAVAGSNGKTTTKEMVTAVLSAKYNVLSTSGNLNNHIGVPQTLFRLEKEHEAAVVEIGTNHFGELALLCDIAAPTHGVITNIGKEHLEFFKDEEGVAKEERTLFRYLESTKGFAFVNADDRYLAEDVRTMKRRMTYGVAPKSDLRARKVRIDDSGRTRFEIVDTKKERSFTVSLNALGMHNVTNALAAAAIGLKLRVAPAKIAAALAGFSSASKRMEVLKTGDVTILNDTYNSNPDSVIVALKTLQSFTAAPRRIAVLGDMRELGDASKREHTNIGAVAAGMTVDRLLTFGPFSRYTSEAFGGTAEHFESKEILAEELKKDLRPGDVLLVKGSRGMRMEEVVQRLTGGPTNNKDTH